MMRKAILASTIAIGFTLAGCMGSGQSNRSLDSVHQPVVRAQTFNFDVNIASGTATASEVTRLSDWLDALEVRYGDAIAIDASGSYVSAAARQQVAALLGRKGLLLSDHAPMTAGEIAPGFMRVVVSRSRAAVPSCPNWSTSSSTNYNSSTTSNYGCATNSNLAAMVANPADLVRGQNSAGNDPLTASRAIDAYRRAAPTGANGLSGSGTTGSGGGSSGGGQ